MSKRAERKKRAEAKVDLYLRIIKCEVGEKIDRRMDKLRLRPVKSALKDVLFFDSKDILDSLVKKHWQEAHLVRSAFLKFKTDLKEKFNIDVPYKM